MNDLEQKIHYDRLIADLNHFLTAKTTIRSDFGGNTFDRESHASYIFEEKELFSHPDQFTLAHFVCSATVWKEYIIADFGKQQIFKFFGDFYHLCDDREPSVIIVYHGEAYGGTVARFLYPTHGEIIERILVSLENYQWNYFPHDRLERFIPTYIKFSCLHV